MHKFPGAAAYLPDPLIGVLPVLAEPIEDLHHFRPALIVQTSIAGADVDRIHQLSIHIELSLRVGPITDAHRPAPAVALQLIEVMLRQIPSTMNGKHRLHGPAWFHFVDARFEPDRERLGLLRKAEREKAIEGKG